MDPARPTVTATTVTVTGLTPATGYEVRVTAANAAGPGPASAPITGTTAATPMSAPAQVTGLAAGTPTASTVPLTWTATPTATAYTVEYRLTGTTAWTVASSTILATTATVSGLAAASPYDFRVTATNSAGTGAPSDVAQATTAPAAATVVETVNAPRASGLPAWRGLIYDLAGERIVAGEEVHRLAADFYGPVGGATLPGWLTLTGGTAAHGASGGGYLRLTTDATAGAQAGLRLAVSPLTTDVRAVLVTLKGMRFSAASPAADWRISLGDGVIGAAAVQAGAMATVALTSQGDLNRTPTPQSHLGAQAARRRDVGLLVCTATKEAWLLEGDSVVGYRHASAAWTDGAAAVGVAVFARQATAVELCLAALEIRLYA